MNGKTPVHYHSFRLVCKLILLSTFCFLYSGSLLFAQQVTSNDPKNTLGKPVTYNIEAFSTLDPAIDVDLLQNSGKLTAEVIEPGTIPSFKYTSKIIWLKVKLDFINPEEGPYMGVIDYPPIDSVLITSYQDTKKLEKHWLGDHHAHSNLTYRKPTFELIGSETHLWVRIQSATSVQFPISIYKQIDFYAEKQKDSVEQSLYYGALLSIFIYNLILAFTTKFKMYRYYIGFLFSYGLFQAIFSGYGVALLWPAAPTFWIDKSLTFFISLVGLFSYLFAFSLLDLKQTAPRLYKIGRFILYLHAPHIIILWLVSYKIGIFWVFFLAFIWSSYLIFISVRLSLRKNRIALIYLFAWFVFILGTMVGILLTFNLLPRNFFTVYSQQIGSVLEFILLSFTMAFKINQIDEQRKEDLESQVHRQTAKLGRIQSLSQKIQNKTSIQEIEMNLRETLKEEYGINNFIFYVISADQSTLYPFSISLGADNAEEVIQQLEQRHLDIKHPRSTYAAVIKRKKALFLSRLPKSQTEPSENHGRAVLKMKSMFLIPLKIDEEVFAVFSLSDTMLKHVNESNVSALNKVQQNDIVQLSDFVSSALYQALQRERVKRAQDELEKQTAKLNQIQYLSQQIQNTSDLNTMIKNLNKVLEEEFAIPSYIFLLLNKNNNTLDVLEFESVYTIPKKIKDKVLNNPLDLYHPKSLHGSIFKKGKPFFLSRLFDVENAPEEISNRELLGVKSLFFLPLKIDGEVFAALTMSDTKYQENDRIKYLTKEERADLEQLSQFVSSALYQALQKEQIQHAQAAVSRAKNEAAVNQLAAHLAHEVNNPLNFIATGKTMQSDSFSKYHEMILGVLSGDDKETKEFKAELDKLQKKFDQGMQQTNEGQDRIAKVIAEIRAITGVDGLNFTNFDAVAVLKEELAYSLQRNNLKSNQIDVKETGTHNSVEVLSNVHILARSIRTVISNCIHFAREHRGDESELYINCELSDDMLLIYMGNNGNSIKNENINELFDLEKSKAYGTEQIGLAMIKELLHKINAELVLADHGRESGKVVFQLQLPLGS